MKKMMVNRKRSRVVMAGICLLCLLLLLIPAAYGEQEDTDTALGQLNQPLPSKTQQLMESALQQGGEGG